MKNYNTLTQEQKESITSELEKEDKHHIFSYYEVKFRLLTIFGKPKSNEDAEKFSNLCMDTWKKIPKFKISVKKHRSIHQEEQIRFKSRISKARKEGLKIAIKQIDENIREFNYILENKFKEWEDFDFNWLEIHLKKRIEELKKQKEHLIWEINLE